ncbi:helix-turn-helix domain-containing protein [Bacillus atrophaeus]|uniref:helix-turn-helix transcriptional regulator n=1 Tax=Bacillus atrophaeus TaxID=1452 RepID=UPI002282F20D|nr:helix-turn-helix domain-containing protein [Bacillus atrophaeus]MCY9198911.1 helix-turn-helix domain-containing protein [Bacillus atrophaeus]
MTIVETIVEVSVLKMKTRLKTMIEKDGRSQVFIAGKIGISETALSSLANGKSLPTLPVAYKIAKYFDVRIEDIWYPDK